MIREMEQPPAEDHVEDRLCLTLHKASRAMTATYRKVLQPLDLTYPQYTVMSALWQQDPATVRELGDVLGSDYSTMSPLIKRLEGKALVLRARNSTDEREVLVHLTREGRQLRDRAASVQADMRRAAGLSRAELDRLVEELGQLTERLQAFDG